VCVCVRARARTECNIILLTDFCRDNRGNQNHTFQVRNQYPEMFVWSLNTVP